jgi:hypothetical protein
MVSGRTMFTVFSLACIAPAAVAGTSAMARLWRAAAAPDGPFYRAAE